MDELARAQAELGRALGRARVGEDRDLAQRVRESGEGIAHLLAGLLKLCRVHAPDNRAFDAPVAEFARVLGALVELLGTVHLVTVEDQIYVNDVRIRSDGKSGARDLGADLARQRIGGLSFHAPLPEAQVRALAAALAAAAAPEGARAALVARLQQAGITTVETAGVFRFRTEAAEERQRAPEEVVRRMLALVGETSRNLAAGRALNPLPLRRMILEALDAGVGAPAFWGPFPGDAPVHAVHAVEVATLALVAARAAGFSPGFLQDLGIAALLHDAGYLTPGMSDGPPGLARHPLEGARLVLRQRGFHEAKLRRLRAILEHHRDYGAGQVRPSAAGALLRLAEDYANVVRLYGAKVLRADALGAMLKAGGAYYQPALAQVLVNALGKFPPGTLVELEDGRFGRVAAPARSAELWDRPLVRLLDPRTRLPGDEIVDASGARRVRRALPG
ncbi:MAG TPA: HD domain-containing protein [Anaeromyxobacter sp.]|nr:HD domain-containing protein [Anaeromyxobacter sp.]